MTRLTCERASSAGGERAAHLGRVHSEEYQALEEEREQQCSGEGRRLPLRLEAADAEHHHAQEATSNHGAGKEQPCRKQRRAAFAEATSAMEQAMTSRAAIAKKATRNHRGAGD